MTIIPIIRIYCVLISNDINDNKHHNNLTTHGLIGCYLSTEFEAPSFDTTTGTAPNARELVMRW